MNWENIFSIGKSELERIMNCAHTAETLALGNAQNKNINI